MSTAHARLVREGRGFVLEDAGSRNGTLKNGVPASRSTLADGDVIELGRTSLLYRDTGGEALDLDEADLSPLVGNLRTLSPRFSGELERLVRLAATDISVILSGETGTGKERRLQELFPDRFAPLYSMVAFTRTPYAEAVRIDRVQRRVIDRLLGLDGIEARLRGPEMASIAKHCMHEVV